MNNRKCGKGLNIINKHPYFIAILCLCISVVCTGCSGDDGKIVETSEVSSGSSNEAYDISKSIYEELELAQVITERYGADIYEVWRLSLQNPKDFDLEEFSSGLFLSQEEITTGMFYYMLGDEYGRVLSDGSESEKKLIEESALYLPQLFGVEYSDNLAGAYVGAVFHAYVSNGGILMARSHFDTVEELLRDMSEFHSGYEHYQYLRDYYIAVNSYHTFCMTPTGTFNQYQSTMNDYVNQIRDSKVALSFIFG